MKTIIAGSRSITDYSEVWGAVNDVEFQITEVVCGMAKGVDLLGKRWAEKNRVPVKEFPADWDAHGKAAGPIRNRQMAEYAEALILVWDGQSKGSANMLQEAKKRGLKIYQHIA
jgi:hypothetical protein